MDVSGSAVRLQHLAFFNTLAETEETTPEWASVSAGLVLLRLVDSWLTEGGDALTRHAWGVRAVRGAIDEVTERTVVRALLERILSVMESSPAPEIRRLSSPLMAYGQALEYEARWTLAADVYRTLIAYTPVQQDPDVVIMAQLRLGHSCWNADEMAEATAAYTAAESLATEIGDLMGVLRARIGEAKIAVRRGNLPRAEAMLDETIARADTPALQDVRSRALHDRGIVAYHRGDFAAAVQYGYRALECSTRPTERDRILSDIALAFVELGVLSAARDAYLVLAATADEQFVRWAATLNLMDIAARDGSQPLFERYRRELERASLPAHMATAFALNAGQGYVRLGQPDEARAYLERARTDAERHGFGRLLFAAEEQLEQLARARPMPRPVLEEVPAALTGIVARLRSLGKDATVEA